jgi:hypothetical protein
MGPRPMQRHHALTRKTASAPRGGGGAVSERGLRAGERVNITLPQARIAHTSDRKMREEIARNARQQDADERKGAGGTGAAGTHLTTR